MCKNTAKKLPYLLRYVSDQYKTQQMCEHWSLLLAATKIMKFVISSWVDNCH